jgi:hypothetical protein
VEVKPPVQVERLPLPQGPDVQTFADAIGATEIIPPTKTKTAKITFPNLRVSID